MWQFVDASRRLRVFVATLMAITWLPMFSCDSKGKCICPRYPASEINNSLNTVTLEL